MGQSDWVITKRYLGIMLLGGGLLAVIGILGLDIVRGGDLDFGPTQQLALVGAALIILIGLTLIPLGDRPA
jgi:hypothetical protein